MATVITVIHVLASLLLILVVLLQSGKGAEISASLGGSSNTVFGSSGGANFFTYFTAGCATVFFLTSITLTGLRQPRSAMEGYKAPPAAAAPAASLGTTPDAAAPLPDATAPAAPTDPAKP